MRRAQRRKYHYLYKTTCKVTGKYYYGMHSTDNLNDGYIGSGKKLWHSINKYGEENHICEKLEFFETREKLKERESELVNESVILDPSCMNIALGGGGGFISEEYQRKRSSAGGKKAAENYKKNPKKYEYKRRILSETLSRLLSEGIANPSRFNGKTHSEKSKQKMREVDRTGIKNSQFGSCWITNGKENRKIKKGDNIPEGFNLGRKIK